MGQFDNFSGGVELPGAMYAHGETEIKWHSASKTYDIASSAGAGSTAWADITGIPTTLLGYGITDASSDSELAAHEADATNIHGIADSAALVITTDPRLSDARTPTAHASSHQNGGTDEILVTGLSGLLADAQTSLTHDIISAHNGFPGGGTTFLRDDGAFAVPPSGGSPPTGTGFRHIAAGVEDAAAKLVDTADVNNDQITWAKLQNISATDRLLGRSTAGAGDTEEIPCTAFARTILDDVDGPAVRGTIGAGTSSFDGVYSSLSGIPATFAPSAHATSHQNGGSDEINVGGLSGLLADGQTPVSHATSHINGGTDELNVGGLNGVLADPQPPIIGAGGTQAVAGNDARLTDARTPTAHATSHINGGGDELNVAGLNGLLADGQTPLVHNILTAHNGFPGGTATFLRADGAFAAAGGAASISSATVSLAYASRSHSATVTDASVSPTSKIIPALGQCLPTDANEGDMIGLASMTAVAGAGDFVLNLAFDAPMGGPLKINYMLG